MWWDIRKLVEPVETLVLEYPGYKPDVTLGGITLEYESTMVRRKRERENMGEGGIHMHDELCNYFIFL